MARLESPYLRDVEYVDDINYTPDEPTVMTLTGGPTVATEAPQTSLDEVAELYRLVLGREPDPGGLAYWASVFGVDVSPEEAAAFKQAAQPELNERARIAEEQEAIREENIRQENIRRAALEEQARLQAAREQEARDLAAREEAARQEAARQEAARIAAQQEAARLAAQQEAARVAAQQEAARQEALRQEAARQQAARVAAEQEAARLAAQQEAARQEAARQEAARQETIRQEMLRQEAARQEAMRIAAEQEAARQEAARQEAARQEAAKAEAARQEALRQEYARQEAERIRAEEAARAEAARLEAERIAAASVKTPQEDILTKTSGFIGTKTEGDKTYQTLDVQGLVKFIDENALSYSDVANALATKFPTLKAEDLLFERDRQTINQAAKTVQDPKDPTKTITTVSYVDALNAAINKGVGIENLAKFFNQTPDQIRSTVANNLTGFATALRDANIDAAKGLSSLLGIPSKDTTAALQTFDKDRAVTTSLEQKQSGGLTLNEILDVMSTSGMNTDDFVSRYFGKDNAALINSLKNEQQYTPAQRNLREAYAGFTSGFNKDNPLTYEKIAGFIDTNKLSDQEASSTLGIPLKELSDYRTDTRLTTQLNKERADDGKLTLSEILDVVDSSGMDINAFVDRYFGKDQSALATSLAAEKKFTPEQRDLRESYATFIQGLGDKKPTLADVAQFVDQKKLSDAQAEQLFGVPEKDLGSYRKDAFITSNLNKLQESDNRLDFSEIVTFAQQNDISLTDMAKYLGTPDKQESTVKALEEAKADMTRTPSERLALQLNQLTNGGTQSGTWDRNNGWDHHAQKMTNYLTGLGVTDLRNIATKVETRDIVVNDYDLGIIQVPGPTVVYYDKTTGKELQAVPKSENNGAWEFGSEGSGKGSTGYILAPTSKDGVGGVGVTSQWREKYGVQEYAMPVAFIAAVAAPYLLPELIGGVVGGVELAALGGEMVAGTGLTGTLMSAGIPASVAPYAAQILVNGVYGGTVSEATGGDFVKGFMASGIAPTFGQITSNAVNSVLADLNLPPGIDKAAGNAMMQLIAKGEIDPIQMLSAGVSPSISKAMQDATGLNAAQTKLLLDTVVTQGNNLKALLNPSTAINFVMQNKDVFDKLGTGAASGQATVPTGQTIDLGAFNADQISQLKGQDTVATLDTVSGGQVDTVSPGAGTTGPDVIDEFKGYDSAIKAAQAIASGATQFEGVEAVQRFNEARAAGALDYQGYDLAKLENALIENQKTFGNAFAAARELYGPNATFNYGGKLYSTATFQERPDLGITQVEGSGRGTAAGKTAEQEALLNQAAQQLQVPADKTTANAGIWDAAKTWVQNQLKLSSQEAEKYLKENPNSPFTQSVSEAREAAGELLKNVVGGTALMLDNKPLAKAFIEGGESLIKSGQAIGTGPQDTKNFSDTIELMRAAPSVADKVGIMFGRMFDGTSGFSRQTMIELRQELPAFFSGGIGVRTAMIASGLIDTADTAGNAAIEAYDGAIKQGKTDAEALSVARQAGLAAGATEAAVQLTLGKLADFGVNKLDNVFAKAGARTGAEYLTEGAQEGLGSAATDYVVKGAVDLNEAITKGLIGAQIGGQLSGASSPLAISQDLANRPIVAVDAQVISVDPQNKLALVQTQGGTELIDTSSLGDVKQGQNLQVSIPAPVTPINVGKPDIAFTEIPVNGTKSTLVTLSPSQYLPDEDRVIALVDIGNGTTQPFYISTGLGGKVETEPGKWYPFFGIGSDGWFNKTTGKDQANYYNSSLLRDISQTLDATIGDVRAQSRTYPVIKVSDTGPISFINKDMSPLSYTGAALDAQKFYGNIAGNLIRIENSASGLEASLIKAIEDGTIKDVQQIQTKLDSLNIPADTKSSLLNTGTQLLGGGTVQDAGSDLKTGAVVPSSGQPVAAGGAGVIAGGPTVITGGPAVTFDSGPATGKPTIITDASQTAGGPAVTTTGTGVTTGGPAVTTGGTGVITDGTTVTSGAPTVTTGGPAVTAGGTGVTAGNVTAGGITTGGPAVTTGATTGGTGVTAGGTTVTTGATIATDAAQAAVNAANTANTNAQAATGAANVLTGTGAVNTGAINNAVQQAATAASNATQNATTATQAAATGNTTAAVNASNNAAQNANVTQNITTDLANTFKPKEEFEEPKPVVTTTVPTVTPPATVTPTVPPITVTPPTAVTPPTTVPVTPTVPPVTVEPPATGPTTTPPTSPTKPASPTTPVKPPVPSFPSLFFPIRVGQDGTQYIDYGYPDVPPPQLPPYTPFGAPNYLRPLDPYLGYGLGALMGGLYAQEPGNGGNQSLQNAQAQAAPTAR